MNNTTTTRTYKGITYRLLTNSFGGSNGVLVFWAGERYHLPNVDRAKSFINSVVEA